MTSEYVLGQIAAERSAAAIAAVDWAGAALLRGGIILRGHVASLSLSSFQSRIPSDKWRSLRKTRDFTV